MVEVREIINERVEERLAVIEQKLRNSFRNMRIDNEESKKSLKEVIDNLQGFSRERVLQSVFDEEMKKLREEIKAIKKDLEMDFEDKYSSSSKRIKSLEKELSDVDLSERVRKSVLKDIEKRLSEILKKQKEKLKEISKENDKKISKEFDKYKNKADDIKKEFVMFRNEFVVLRESLDKWKIEIGRELNSLVEEKEETFESRIKDLRNQINSLKARNTILTKELNELKGKNSKKLEKQPKKPIKKKTSNNKTFLSKIVDSLAD